jgi:hypothetical protein
MFRWTFLPLPSALCALPYSRLLALLDWRRVAFSVFILPCFMPGVEGTMPRWTARADDALTPSLTPTPSGRRTPRTAVLSLTLADAWVVSAGRSAVR